MGISTLEDDILELKNEMAEVTSNGQVGIVSPTYAIKKPPQSTNSKIVKDLITQVNQLRKELKHKVDEELVYESRENDFVNERQVSARENWQLRKEIRRLKRENDELYLSIARSEDRLSGGRRMRTYGGGGDSDDDFVLPRKMRRTKK